jgi:hypothetical protein
MNEIHCKMVKDYKSECKGTDCVEVKASCSELNSKAIEDFTQKITDGYDAQL